jgi:hypothetical protein
LTVIVFCLSNPHARRRWGLALVLMAAAACGATRDVASRPDVPADPVTFSLRGQFSIAAQARYPHTTGLLFGGISGLAAVADGKELLGLSDDRRGSRVYRFGLSGTGATFKVETLEVIQLGAVPPSVGDLDPEGLVALPNGNLLVSSDGIGTEPRVPPVIVEFLGTGAFVREVPIPDRFKPNPTGPQVKGVRTNTGFESLTLSADGNHLFTASEAALVQDGEMPTFDQGSPSRIVEFGRDGDSFTPRREFLYMVEPTYRPPFTPGLAVNGLVELLALEGGDLLALERSYVQESGAAKPRDMNHIRLFRVSLAGATDVSKIESLKDAPNAVPVKKTLLFDLSDVPGLSPELAPSLDNFEGMAFLSPLPDGRSAFILVSDDNFNPVQRTWFLQFAAGPTPAAAPSQQREVKR